MAYKYNAIFELKAMLEKDDIPFKFEPLFDGGHIIFDPISSTSESLRCSVIEHSFSYGHERDLLEIQGLLTDEEKKVDDVVGYLTATEVYDRIKKAYKDSTSTLGYSIFNLQED